MATLMGRRERKKLQSKQTIMEAAIEKFQSDGVRETSIADIMTAAGLGIGTFYNYFESKEALLLSLLEQAVEQTRTVSQQLMAEKISAPEVLSNVMLTAAQHLDENRYVLPLFLRAAEAAGQPKDSSASEKSGHVVAPEFKTVVFDIVRYGQERGEFRTDVSPEIMTEMFHSILQAAAFSTLPVTFIENVKTKVELLLTGMEPRG